MQLDALKVFCDVVRQRSFSLAAEANDLSQSAASQIVGHLERRLGVKLIDRTTRPLEPTRLGQLYCDGCASVLDQYGKLEGRIRRAHIDMASQVRVAAIYSVGLSDMHEHEARFADLNPHIRVHVDYLHPNEVYDQVERGGADFGLVSFPRRLRQLEVVSWRQEEMVLACARHHRLARRRYIRPEQLHEEKFVGFERGLDIRREIDRFLREHGAAARVLMEFDNIETIKKAVEIGAGVSLLPEPAIRKEVRSRSMVAIPLAGAGLIRPLSIIHRRAPELSLAARRFLDLLREDSESSRHAGFKPATRNRDKTKADAKPVLIP